jgi:hypothetical protein
VLLASLSENFKTPTTRAVTAVRHDNCSRLVVAAMTIATYLTAILGYDDFGDYDTTVSTCDRRRRIAPGENARGGRASRCAHQVGSRVLQVVEKLCNFPESGL